MLYTIYLNFKNRILEYTLPSGENLRYDIDISEETDTERCMLSFENIDGVWSLVCGRSILTDSGERCVISGGDKINAYVRNSSLKFLILVSCISDGRIRFRKYILADSTSIGSDESCSIMIPGEFISGRHAVISRDQEGFLITDYSTNGIYINGERAGRKTVLKIFDTVYIFGTKIIFLGNAAAVNGSDEVKVSLKKLSEYAEPRTCSLTKNVSAVYSAVSSYSGTGVCVLGDPSVSTEVRHRQDINDIFKTSLVSSALLSCAVSFTGELSAAESLGFFPAAAAVMSLLMAAAGRAVGTAAERKLSKKMLGDKEKYIFEKRKELERMSEYLSAKLDSENRPYSMLLNAPDSTLCTRKKSDADFAVIRTGRGEYDISSCISADTDDEGVNALAHEFSTLRNAAVISDLRRSKLTVISGDEKITEGISDSLIFHLAGENSSRDLKIYIFLRSCDRKKFGWMRWLPHVFSEDRKCRHISADEETRKNCMFSLMSELQRREMSGCEESDPHIAVFFSSEQLLENEPVKKYIFSEKENGVSFIVSGNGEELRKKASILFSGTEDPGKYIISSELSSFSGTADAEFPSREECEYFARRLIRKNHSEEGFVSIPDSVSFFEMLNIRDIPDADILKNYKIYRARDGISAVIGTDRVQNGFEIDLHEKKHGPHGLIAGMTGSGKSEVLQTLILSLAIKYSPQELSFVLVDYKGGGMSDAFEELPHIAGIITNLTDSANDSSGQSRRVLVSLRSEVRKRQQIFSRYHINHIDTYSKLISDGTLCEPLPHIVIVVDEFAELKREQPEFISQLVSISRIGRSLGIHLILATQKPSGVVSDEIWSNSRFRICLRVQDRNDSMEMLRREEASSLTNAGRAYVQIGNNEIFEMIQTGYSGAEYHSSGYASEDVSMIEYDGSGSVIKLSDESLRENGTQLSETVRYIIDICRKNNICSARRLWIPGLPEILRFTEDDSFRPDRGLICSAGIADDPENQKIYSADLELGKDLSLIAAGQAGSGKTNLVKIMLSTLMKRYSPDEFRYIIFDFAGGSYRRFSRTSFSMGVYEDADGSSLREFFENMSAEIRRRKKRFSEEDIHDFSQYRMVYNDLPAVTAVFDGYYIFRELYPEKEDDFLAFSRDGARYGIYVIATVRQLSDIKFRIRYNFRSVIAFSLADRTEYQLAFSGNPGFDIPSIPGRGLIKLHDILEFQSFLFEDSMIPESAFAVKEKNNSNEMIADDVFCAAADDSVYDDYYEFLKKAGASGNEVLFWSACERRKSHDMIKYYSGAHGLRLMLTHLRDIFSVRRDIRRSSGETVFEKVFAVTESLDDLCACVSEEKDLFRITETFLRGGQGYGVCFISAVKNDDKMKDSQLYRLFISNTTGAENVKSICI